MIEQSLSIESFHHHLLTLFMISVRSPCGLLSSSSGVGGNGRFGGPPPLCPDALCVVASSDNALSPGLYENSGLIKSKDKTKQKIDGTKEIQCANENG